MRPKHDYSLMEMGRADATIIFVFYFSLIVIGLITIVISLPELNRGETKSGADFYILFSSSFLGTSIFYTRKLYKALINSLYSIPKETFTLRRIGTLAFFLFRPVFGAVFSLVVFALWQTSIHLSVDDSTHFKESIQYVVLAIGFSPVSQQAVFWSISKRVQ